MVTSALFELTRECRASHEVVDSLTVDWESRGPIGHQSLSLRPTNLWTKICFGGLAKDARGLPIKREKKQIVEHSSQSHLNYCALSPLALSRALNCTCTQGCSTGSLCHQLLQKWHLGQPIPLPLLPHGPKCKETCPLRLVLTKCRYLCGRAHWRRSSDALPQLLVGPQ